MLEKPWRVRHSVKTAAEWAATTSIPLMGEECFTFVATGQQMLWKVGDGVTAWSGLPYQNDALNLTGWGSYSDAGTQSIAANTRTLLTISGVTKDETQKPSDIATFWNGATNTLPGRDGDGGVWRLKFQVTATDATASTLLIEADIGGAIGVLDEFEKPMTRGAGVMQPVTWNNAYFMRATFAANGAKFYVTSDGPLSIAAKSILIHRTHRAR